MKQDAKPASTPRQVQEEDRIRRAYAARTDDASRYAMMNPGHLFLMQTRERRVLELLRRHRLQLEELDILEVGCGRGTWLRDLIRWGASPERLHGVELRADAVETARRLCPATVDLRVGTGTDLPYDSDSIDLVLQSMVFSSILDGEVQRAVAREMARVLRGDGRILWYDFFVRHPRNSDVRGVRKARIRELFPGHTVRLTKVSLAAPVARFLAPRSWLACQLLQMVPLARTHYLGIIDPG